MEPSEELLKKLEQDDLTDAELDHLYRTLSKQTHPDLTGSDGSAFILLRERYLAMKARNQERQNDPAGVESDAYGGREPDDSTTAGWRDYGEPRSATADAATVETGRSTAESDAAALSDPLRVIRECGYHGDLTARQCLYVALNRYYALGMYTHRMRVQGAGDRRIELVRATIFYWAKRYDPSFIEVFRAYDQNYHVTVTDMSYRDRLFARRSFLAALDWFFRFQDRGRPGTGKVFSERAHWARAVLQRRRFDPQAVAMLRFLEWLIREYASPPVMLAKLS